VPPLAVGGFIGRSREARQRPRQSCFHARLERLPTIDQVPVVTLNLPSDEEEELLRRFTVNRNYLQALQGFLHTTYGRRDALYQGLARTLGQHPPFLRINRGAADLGEVRRFLTLAWASEMQLHLPALMENTAVLAFANAWAPVHAYYAVFGGLQAWFAANGITGTADDHTSSLKTIASQIQQRELFPEPWSLLAAGCPMRGDRTYIHDHGQDCGRHIEVLSIPVPFGHDPDFWPRYGAWLRSTRTARLTAREEQWKRQHKKRRISPAERTAIAKAVAPTSLFDCLWRMRIRSNYGTIDPYLVGQISETDHRIFNTALCTVERATLALLELYIARKIGKQALSDIAREFVRQDAHGLTEKTLQARLAAFGL
jgi:hypothetical protein